MNQLHMPSWLNRARNAEKAPFVFLFLIYLASSYMPLGNRITRLFLLSEDRLLESLSAIFLLVSSILLLLAARQAKSHRQLKNDSSPLLLTLSTMIFFWFAEEISWGQRILNFNIESIEAINAQSETNIHNLNSIQPYLHYAYFLVFITVAILCIAPREKAPTAFSLLPSQKIFYYFFLPAVYYFIGQILRDIPIEIRGYVFDYKYTHNYQEAYEFLLAVGILRFSRERFKAILRIKAPEPDRHC